MNKFDDGYRLSILLISLAVVPLNARYVYNVHSLQVKITV
jgi:hypothetical protein